MPDDPAAKDHAMTIDAKAIERLTAKLTGDAPAALTADERTLIVHAMGALITSEMLVARQSQLLRSYQDDEAELDRAGAASLARFAQSLNQLDISSAYDSTAAKAARAALIRQIDDAESLRDFITEALKFAAAITILTA